MMPPYIERAIGEEQQYAKMVNNVIRCRAITLLLLLYSIYYFCRYFSTPRHIHAATLFAAADDAACRLRCAILMFVLLRHFRAAPFSPDFAFVAAVCFA